MKKTYTIALALLLTGSVFAQKFTGAHTRFEGGNQPFATSTENTSTPAILKSATATLNETFTTVCPPVGWSATNWLISGTTATNNTLEAKAPGNTGHFAYFWAPATAGTIGNLVTPKLAPTSGNKTLSYKVNYFVYDATWADKGAAMYIEYSEDGGTTWTTSTTNELEALPNYNSSTTGWITNTVDMSAYVGKEVMVRFRAEADYGMGVIGLDNVTGPEAILYTNEIAGKFYLASMKNMGFSWYTPFQQLDSVFFYAQVKNNGTAAQTNVTLNVDVNNGLISSIGLKNPKATMAVANIDTLGVKVLPASTSSSLYEARLWLTQTQTDEVPANNILDSVWFATTNNFFMRTTQARVAMNASYYAQTSVPTITGFEYGSRYTMKAAGRVDSIQAAVSKSVGTGTVVGKLYTVTGTTTLTYTKVAETAPFSPPAGLATDWTKLKFTTPYQAAAGTKLAAMIQQNINTATDTIWIGMDNQFIGSTSSGSLAYMNVKPTSGAAAMGWYTLPYQPVVGLILNDPTSVKENNFTGSKVSVYPNPANDVVNLNNIGNNAKVSMVNSLGQVVFSTVATDRLSINTTDMNEGIYFVRVDADVFKVVLTK